MRVQCGRVAREPGLASLFSPPVFLLACDTDVEPVRLALEDQPEGEPYDTVEVSCFSRTSLDPGPAL